MCTIKRRKKRPSHRDVVGVGIRDQDGNIFLIRTRKLSDWWQPIAGEVEPDMSPVDTACKQLKAQLGITHQPDDLTLRMTIPYDFCDGNVYVYEIIVDRSLLTIKPDRHVIVEHEWFTPADSLNLQAFPSTATYLQTIASESAT